MKKIIPLLVLCLVLSACATSRGFNRGALRDSLANSIMVSDEEIQKTFDLKPQLPKPFKLGVYFVDPNAPGSNPYNRPTMWRWSEANREAILSLGSELKASGEASDVFLISPASVTGNDLRSLRLAAAKHGADAILVVSGTSDTDNYNNGWAWTYWLLLPTLFAPGTTNDVLFIARAAMWDTRNQFLYMTAEAESLNERKSAVAFVNERKQIETAKNDSIARLREELRKTIASIPHEPTKLKPSP